MPRRIDDVFVVFQNNLRPRRHGPAGGSKFTGELKGGTLDNFHEGVTGVPLFVAT
jgi:hypothetical protein